jgi:hypothetical protein
MATKIQLQIEIGPDGDVRIKTEGLKGESCLAETESLERALGEVKSRAKTSEYFSTGAASHTKTGSGAAR